MKILIINSVPYGSTATISCNIARLCKNSGFEAEVCFGYSYHPIKDYSFIKIGGYFNKAIHMILSRITGLHGVFSWIATMKFLKWVRKYNPDIIHIHNLHGWYINIPMLVNYIKKENKPVVWTLHDCWALTGHCPHYDMIGCSKWKSECHKCSVYNQYPRSYIDASKKSHNLKKKWFGKIQNLTIVTPSKWLAEQVAMSYLKEKDCMVINNGIDLTRFDIKEEYKKEPQSIFNIIGVSFGWDEKKGLDVFIKLSEMLDDSFKITLVGTDENIDKILPSKIISIHRTQNQEELIELYNKSDVFVNATREDTFPTVNIEALACGLPVITFNTGGSPEIIDEKSGIVVPKNDISAMADAIKSMSKKRLIKQDCRNRSLKFEMNSKFSEYIDLYRKIYERQSKCCGSSNLL